MTIRASDAEAWRERDPLDSVLLDLRLSGTFFCRARLRDPWVLGVPQRSFVAFHFVSDGRCALVPDPRTRAGGPIDLDAGDLVIVTRGLPHRLTSGGRVGRRASIEELPREPPDTVASTVERGGRGAGRRAILVCGGVSFVGAAAHRLIQQMPEVFLLRAREAPRIMRRAFDAMRDEARAPLPGGSTVMTRLADVVLVYAFRAWLASAGRHGWLAALSDPQIGRAMAAIHSRPEKRWSVDSLARAAGLARSRFTERFVALVGEPPVRYATGVAMHRAAELLRTERLTLDELAERLGYESAPALARTFKRHMGTAPGTFKRSPGWRLFVP